DTLTDAEERLVSGFRRPNHYFPEPVPKNTTLLFSLSETHDWRALYSISLDVLRHWG
ncbi:hypothetical protein HZA99_03020, partial [Candidatus Woesearchaeota archaeon]|nr:hypothetical protein [Candidatus Woesearchaeota archaeon]